MINLSGRKPLFENVLKVLRRQVPSRPVLFELFMNDAAYAHFAGRRLENPTELEHLKLVVDAYISAGYDYATVHASAFSFLPRGEAGNRHQLRTISLNEHPLITDRRSFEAFPWPDPESFDSSKLDAILPYLPDNFRLMLMGPCGVLENVISLVGYDNLCYMLYEDPDLVQAIFDKVGSTLLRYYETGIHAQSVGFMCANDDWGFNTQTFLSTADMRRYVFPWHKKLVALAHGAGKPCLLHSCGSFSAIMDDIIDDMKFDARHSYEDKIMPVEEAYERYHDRIAILGGMDIGFLMTQPLERITERARAMLARTADRGGYALGTGNSVPEYLPLARYLAMARAAYEGEGACK